MDHISRVISSERNQAYSSISDNANRRRTLRNGVIRWTLGDATLSRTCSLCTTLRLPPDHCLNKGMASIQRHLEENGEVRLSKGEADSGRRLQETDGDLAVSDLPAHESAKAPSSRSGLDRKDCSCVKKGTRSDSTDDSLL